MGIQKVDSIPTNSTMLERAEVYRDAAGNYYACFTPSPDGVDQPKQVCLSAEPLTLWVEDPSGNEYQAA